MRRRPAFPPSTPDSRARTRPTLVSEFTPGFSLGSAITLTLALMWSMMLSATATAGGPCWTPPVIGHVVEHYETPACPYCAGNRGIEYATAPGAVVRAVQAGIVTFSGRVVDSVYVVVEHADGRRVTYGHLEHVLVERGATVAAGTRLGSTSGRLYFGLRVGSTYLDPEPHLGQLVGRPRLVPVDGTERRPAPPARLRCA